MLRGVKSCSFTEPKCSSASQGSSRDAQHCRLSGVLPKGETFPLGGQQIQKEVPDEFHRIPGLGCSQRGGKEQHRVSTARPDDAKEIIEASGIRLGLQLAKSIIANQFFDDLCPLLFGFGIAHGGTGNFTNSHAKPRC